MTKEHKKLTLLASFIIVILSFPAFFFMYFLNRVYPGVFVAGINLSGKSKNEAVILLEPKINTPESITLNYSGKTFDIPVNSLNITFNKDKTIKKTMQLRRSTNISLDVRQIIGSIKHKTNYSLELNFDESVLNNSILAIADKINIDPKNAQFTIID